MRCPQDERHSRIDTGHDMTFDADGHVTTHAVCWHCGHRWLMRGTPHVAVRQSEQATERQRRRTERHVRGRE